MDTWEYCSINANSFLILLIFDRLKNTIYFFMFNVFLGLCFLFAVHDFCQYFVYSDWNEILMYEKLNFILEMLF